MEKVIPSIDALAEEAKAFVTGLVPREEATLITLSGELGAGKTAFVKAAAAALGIPDDLTSPTFVLMKQYQISNGAFAQLIHIDAYRLESGEELAPLKLDELLKDKKNLIMLEWPEKVAEKLSPAAVAISIRPNEDGSRTLSYQ